MPKRQKMILEALWYLGAMHHEVTTRQVAEQVGLNVNGVAQTLGVMSSVVCLGGQGGETKWKLKN